AGHSFGGYTTLAVGGGAYAVDAWQADCPDYALPRICDALPEAAARYRAGFADPRVKALIAMAPGDYLLFLDGLGAIETPVLHLTGRLDRMTTEAGSGTPIWQALQGPAHRRVQFAAGGHFTFTNLCPWIGGLGRDDGCGPDFTPPAEAHPVIIEYVWAFLQWQLFGDDAGRALLDGPPLHPAVEVLRKEAE
ncbi:MAG: hypothetical protein KC620_14560, partial [Myxococcales bacterium]|nr:hypothetical protein [Myxococcales bacterium]